MQTNLARAQSQGQFDAISQEFERIDARQQSLRKELHVLTTAETQSSITHEQEGEVLDIVRGLVKLCDDDKGLEFAGQIFQRLEAKLYLAFGGQQLKKRIVNKVQGGVVTFGDAKPPIEVYAGPTSRRVVKDAVVAPSGDCSHAEELSFNPDNEKSIGNVSRAERI